LHTVIECGDAQHIIFKMLYRCPYEDGHVYACCKVGWFAHPVPGHGKRSGYATAQATDMLAVNRSLRHESMHKMLASCSDYTAIKIQVPESEQKVHIERL